MLRLLSLGPFQDSCFFAEALLDVMAASAASAAGVPLLAFPPTGFRQRYDAMREWNHAGIQG